MGRMALSRPHSRRNAKRSKVMKIASFNLRRARSDNPDEVTITRDRSFHARCTSPGATPSTMPFRARVFSKVGVALGLAPLAVSTCQEPTKVELSLDTNLDCDTKEGCVLPEKDESGKPLPFPSPGLSGA